MNVLLHERKKYWTNFRALMCKGNGIHTALRITQCYSHTNTFDAFGRLKFLYNVNAKKVINIST